MERLSQGLGLAGFCRKGTKQNRPTPPYPKYKKQHNTTYFPLLLYSTRSLQALLSVLKWSGVGLLDFSPFSGWSGNFFKLL